jgi:hypothetical protein
MKKETAAEEAKDTQKALLYKFLQENTTADGMDVTTARKVANFFKIAPDEAKKLLEADPNVKTVTANKKRFYHITQ